MEFTILVIHGVLSYSLVFFVRIVVVKKILKNGKVFKIQPWFFFNQATHSIIVIVIEIAINIDSLSI